jgi:hypothetical protein
MNTRMEPAAAPAPSALVKAAVSPVKRAPDASLKCSMCTELAATRFEPGRLPNAMPALARCLGRLAPFLLILGLTHEYPDQGRRAGQRHH